MAPLIGPPSSGEPLLTPLMTSTSPPEPLTLAGPGSSSLRLHSLQQDDLTRRSDSPVANASGQGSASVSSPVRVTTTPNPKDGHESAIVRPGVGMGVGVGAAAGGGGGNAAPGPNGGAPPQGPQDSMTLGQLKAITAGFPKSKQSLYTFPSPPPDTNDLMSELEEFYSYVEVSQVIEHKDSFSDAWPHPTPFIDTSKELQLEHIRHLLDGLASTDPDVRFNNARHLLYIAQGTFQSSSSPEHHLHLILTCVRLLRSAGALEAIWEAVKGTGLRWEGVSSLPDPDAPQSPNGFSQQERQDYLDEINGELALHLAVLYFMMEVYRGDADWADELMALEPPMPIYLFNLVAGLREKNAKGYPVKKLLLLLWKSILSCVGGMKDVERVKLFVREVEGLPPDDKGKKTDNRPETKVAPQDYQTFRNEITSKYPSFVPPAIPNVDLDRISAAASPTPIRPSFSYHINTNTAPSHPAPISAPGHQAPIPGTPAPSPPPSPAAKPKKQQYQTDQSRPFVLPFAPANAGPKGRPRAVPQSIDEAGELYQRNMRISTELWQTWKLREEYMADESGILKAEAAAASMARQAAKAKGKGKLGGGNDEGSKLGRRMESLSLDDEEAVEDEEDEMDPLYMLKGLEKKLRAEEEAEKDEKKKKTLTERRVDVQRLERVEILYRAILPNMQSAVIVLLKLLLATVTANNNLNAQQDPPDSGNDEPIELNLEDTDIMRHREITSKAVSAILILALKWFKASHVMKFHYLSQLLVDSNCLLLILKMFGLQEVSTLVKTKNDRPDHNFFRYCNESINPPQPGAPRPEDAMLEAPPPGARPTSPKEADEDEVELITDYSWRNFFSVINFVHVLQKLTKRKTHRVLLLVQYKSSAILKRILKVSHPTLQLYLLKVIKSQVPYCGRKWRQSNMKVITAIYLHCRPDLRDEWLTGVDVDADVEDSLPHEQALRTLVRFFNTKHYGAYAPMLHRRSSSQNHAPSEFGHLPPPSPGGRPMLNDDVFPPTRPMNSFDPEASFRAAFGHDTSDDVGDYALDDLLFPNQHQQSGEGADGDLLDFDPETSRAVWDRLGDLMGRYDDDISDSESVGSFGLLDFEGSGRRDLSGNVSEFDLDEMDEHEQQRADWEHIDPETITALEEERNATSVPHSPRPSRRRSSTGPISPALRPVLIDRDDDNTAEEVMEDGPAMAEPHKGPAVDEVELVFGR